MTTGKSGREKQQQATTDENRRNTIRITNINTTTMCPEQYDQAVQILAAMIDRWHHDNTDTDKPEIPPQPGPSPQS